MSRPTTRITEAREQLRLALRELRGDPADEEEVEEEEVEIGAVESYLVVGKGEGVPGDTVDVELLAFSSFPTRGVAAAIGCNPLVQLVSAEPTDELRTLLGVTDPQDIVKQQRGRGWQQQFVQIAVMFFEQLWTQAELESADPNATDVSTKPKRTLIDVMIPPMTPIYRMKFKIPDDAEPGTIPLSLEHTYGRKLSSNGPIKFLPWPNLFGTARSVSRHGKAPGAVVSGWIDIVD